MLNRIIFTFEKYKNISMAFGKCVYVQFYYLNLINKFKMKCFLLTLVLITGSITMNGQLACRSIVNVSLRTDGTVTIRPFDVLAIPTAPRPGYRYDISPSSFNCADVDHSFSVIVRETRGPISNSCFLTVNIEDKNLPPSPCQSPSVYCFSELNVALNSDGTATLTPEMMSPEPLNPAFDWSVSPSIFDCTDIGTHEVRLIATSSNGATNFCISEVNIVDRRPGPPPVCFILSLRNGIHFLPDFHLGNPLPPGTIVNFDFNLDKDPQIKVPFDADFRMVLSYDSKMDDEDMVLFSKNFQFKNKVNTYGVQSKFALPYNINPGNYYIIADMAGNSKKGNITFKPYVIPISIGVNGQFVTTQSRSKNNNNENIQISPNPFSDLLFVQDGTIRDKRIEILDIFGKTIRTVNLQSNENSLSLDDLPSALYVIKVTGSEGLLYSGKFCKI